MEMGSDGPLPRLNPVQLRIVVEQRQLRMKDTATLLGVCSNHLLGTRPAALPPTPRT